MNARQLRYDERLTVKIEGQILKEFKEIAESKKPPETPSNVLRRLIVNYIKKRKSEGKKG